MRLFYIGYIEFMGFNTNVVYSEKYNNSYDYIDDYREYFTLIIR
jgi:hypothetical protein